MASASDRPTVSPSEPAWISWVAEHRTRAAQLLFVLALVFAIIAAYFGIRYRGQYLAVVLWGADLALVSLAAGIWYWSFRPQAGVAPRETARLLVLGLGGLIGLGTVLFLGIGLAWTWWETISGGWTAWQGSERWRLWICVLALVGGLAIMFASLLLARADEHASATYRRLLYGYNAALTGFLLLMILTIFNLLVYLPWGPFAFFSTTYQWAQASIYSLSSQSEKVLESLDKPVKVFVLLPRNDEWNRPMHALLDNCRAVNSNIQVKYLSPDLDRDEVDRLVKEYKFGGERRGVLIVYGSEPKAETRFIKYLDLFSNESDMMARNKQPFFKGEVALINELNSLSQGKEKPVVYFTQGNGELDLTDSRPARQLDEGLGALKERLEASNYKVKGLQFSSVAGAKSKNPDIVMANRVPEDAAMVVIAGPKSRFEPFAIEALRNYLEPTDPKAAKGKLVVLLDVVLTPQGAMEMTGLESFLAGFGVQVGNDRLIRLPTTMLPSPESIIVRTNMDRMVRMKNPIVDAFQRVGFLFDKCRTVRPVPTPPQGGTRYQVDTLLVAAPGQSQELWAESNLQTDAVQLLQQLAKADELGKKLSDEPLPVAVAVADANPGAGGPHAFMQSEEKPRMVVFGDASWLSNAIMGEQRGGAAYYDLFLSTLGWLRERPSSIGIEPKKRDFYTLSPDTNVSAMVFVPALLMVVGVIGLGTGVWVVRRR